MKKNTSISVDHNLINKIHEMGMSVSAVAERAMQVIIEDGFDDVILKLKLKFLSDTLVNIDSELSACKERITELEQQRVSIGEAIDDTKELLELSRTVIKLAKLMQRLNKELIINEYNYTAVDQKIINDIKELNPDFNIEKHVINLKNIIGIE